jgi:protease I
MRKALKRRRVAVLATDGFEEVELTTPVSALKKAGATVDIVSLHEGRIRGVHMHQPAGRVPVTRTLGDVSAEAYDALFVPGGFISPDLLRQSARARQFVRAFELAKKPIATLCHGPWVLASAGVLSGRTVTSWPGIRDDMVNAGATWLNEPVVQDGHLITSRGPHDLKPFMKAVVQLFADGDAAADANEFVPRRQASAPQPSDPPEMAMKTTRWLPRPSLRAATGIGLVAAGVIVAKACWRGPFDTRDDRDPQDDTEIGWTA